MRKFLVATLATLSLLATAATAGAAVPTEGSGTLSLNGTPTFQSVVSYSATYPKNIKNPRVWTSCTQNGLIVYGAGTAPEETLKLGGDSSRWVENGGGAASCTAELYFIPNSKGNGEWNGHGGQGPNIVLATITYEAGA
jgi:hypothetical protein